MLLSGQGGAGTEILRGADTLMSAREKEWGTLPVPGFWGYDIAGNFSESVSNWVNFYADGSSHAGDRTPSGPRFLIENGSDGKPAFLEFLDVKGVPARVDLHPRYFD